MKLWRKASGALKDQRSVWIANIARRKSFRNPEIETAIIKATNHDELFIDTENIAFIYRTLRLSCDHHKAVLFAITKRMTKTRSWVVALKGLILMHGMFACEVPSIQKIGRLPFDLSNFRDGHSNPGKTRPHNKFIRSYYAFLDEKSTFLYNDVVDYGNNTGYISKDDTIQASNNNNNDNVDSSMKQECKVIKKLQRLLDLLLVIKPQTKATIGHPLFIEAINCVIVEVFDVYSQICGGISRFLRRICSVEKGEAEMALKMTQKATKQGEELSLYFEVCREIGVLHPSDCPRIETIAKEDLKDLEDIINEDRFEEMTLNEDHHNNDTSKEITMRDHHQVASINEENEYSKQRKMMMTIVTHKWETFDEGLSTKENDKEKNHFEPLISL
ncbi:hypothetical protein Leryth_009405 [Lithospermum erythrorhizon]|uniref:Vesicle coat protein n=1 Tax=Lithospermum erythrorhizon TaxID=34254 RepID=A0AAV3PST4_LITER|nr:hypothetical protein Leryth_009405 [Lithospermum erythrorhizon]